jgi:putative membrane protein
VGVLSFWIVLQTRIDYYAQHMFFVHRWAHFVLHHAGAFFIALGMSGPVLGAGIPDALKPVIRSRPVQATLSFLQHPVMAPFLFVGLLYFWLIPQIHTRVMLDANLYELMNWTMAINGVMFWSLILDSRAKPPARLSHLMRAALILVIELPQMVLGAILSLTEHDIYPVYTICGRVLDMTALNDQHYGGLIIWLPGTLTSFAAMIVVLVTMRLNEERAALEENKSEAA